MIGKRSAVDEVFECRGKQGRRYGPRRQRARRDSRTAGEHAGRRQKHAVEQPCSSDLVVHARQSRNDRGPLGRGDKEKREVVLVIKDAVAGANYGLGIGRPGQTHARLELLAVLVDEEIEASLEVIPQSVIQREVWGDLVLVLGE